MRQTEISPGEWLASAADRYARRPALISAQEVVDYQDLFEHIGAMARYYYKKGLQPGEPLAVVTQQTSLIVWAFYLALYSGCALLPLNPRRAGLLKLLDDCAINQVIADADSSTLLPTGLCRLASDGLQRHDGRRATGTPSPVDHIQLIVPTSGTNSKRPKAVLLSGGNLYSAVQASRLRLGLESTDMWLVCLPMFHIAGLSIQLRCLQAGAAMLLHDRFNPAQVWRDVQQRGVTHISLVSTMLARLLEISRGTPPPQSLKVVLVGGGPLSSSLACQARCAGWPIHPTYGMSETTSQVSTQCAISENWASTDMGKPLDGVQVDIIDRFGNKTLGQGRIRISGSTVMLGYANAKGIPGLGLIGGRFISNDIGHIDAHGHLHVLGRTDDVIISGGENIHPQEIEEQLLYCPGVEEVAVAACPDTRWGQRMIAFVVGDILESDFRRWCQLKLPRSQRPDKVLKVKQLERNSLGKIDRRALRTLIQS